jgi:hypothetical protein
MVNAHHLSFSLLVLLNLLVGAIALSAGFITDLLERFLSASHSGSPDLASLLRLLNLNEDSFLVDDASRVS